MSILAAAATAKTAPKPLVDWSALGQSVAFSLIIGIAIVVILAFSIRLHAAGQKGEGSTKVMENIGAWLGIVVVLAAIAAGIWLILHKG
jgi:cell division protein FtsX